MIHFRLILKTFYLLEERKIMRKLYLDKTKLLSDLENRDFSTLLIYDIPRITGQW